MTGWAKCGSAGIAVLAWVLPPAVAHAVVTINTTYSYNADGALTAITKTSRAGAETTYVTWDNFVPDTSNPAVGTVMTGNGTLETFGPALAMPAQFQFDARHRLTGYTDGNLAERIDYHAGGTLQSTEADGDARHFYFDHSQHAEIMNIHERGQDLWSGMLEHVRYLSDGSEQVLLQPRKDVAAEYDADGQTLDAHHYDAYGAQADVPLQSSYDLHDNPMQYAAEYRDALWGGVYLRARWYHPELPIFLSRDPLPNLNRYGYAGGNAVMRLDPSGMGFFGEIGKALRTANAALNQGVLGHFNRILLSPLMGALQVMAYPKAFWESIKHDKDGIDIFLAAGVLTEGLSIGLERVGVLMAVRTLNHRLRYAIRLAVDSGLGIGQAVVSGADRGFHHFDWDTFAQGAELSLGALSYTHIGFGVGYHPFAMKSSDVLERVRNADSNSVLIFRERTQGNGLKTFTSPSMEMAGIGRYHERIIAVSRDFSASTELGVRQGYGFVKTSGKAGARGVENFFMQDRPARYQFVGSVSKDTFSAEAFRKLNPRGLLAGDEYQERLIDNKWELSPQTAKYKRWTNNCHSHASAVLYSLEFE